MKYARKVNKWLEGAAPTQIPPPTFLFSFLTIERQTKAQVMSWGNAFGKFLAAVSQYTTSLCADAVFAFAEVAYAEMTAEPGSTKQGAEDR